MSADTVETRWGHVDTGALVVDGEGHYWRVLEKRTKLPQIAYLITDGERSLWTVHGYDDEAVLVDETGGRAVLVVQSVMPGAHVLMDPLPKGPDRPWVRAKYLSHLALCHGEVLGTGKVNTLQSLIERHSMLHASVEVRPLINHVHEAYGTGAKPW